MHRIATDLRLSLTGAGATAVLAGLQFAIHPASADTMVGGPAAHHATVPDARCAPGSLPETGISGDVPAADQLDGRSVKGYRCNLSLVGSFGGDGANVMMAWYSDCAYMGTLYSTSDPNYDAVKGTRVLDMSDPANIRETARLQTPAMVSPHESLKVNQRRGLIAADQGNASPSLGTTTTTGTLGPWFDVWDVAKDCRHPSLMASLPLTNGSGHEGDFAPDGMTYYESTIENAPHPAIIAIDLSNPRKPSEILQWQNPIAGAGAGVHGLHVSDDGTVGYFMVQGGAGNGLLVVDLSDIQYRRPNPAIRVISYLNWTDAGNTQLGMPARIGGHPYLITSDEMGSGESMYTACRAGQPPFGFVHIVDIADLKHPKVTSDIRLGVNDPANCVTLMAEPGAGLDTAVSLLYSSHYCSVDDPYRTTTVACTWLGSGLRVFDVSNPLSAREIAYYNPPPTPFTIRTGAALKTVLFPDPFLDVSGSNVRWVRQSDGSARLWFMSMDNGVQVVALDRSVYPPRTAAVAAPGTTESAVGSLPNGSATGPGSTAVPAAASIGVLIGAGFVARNRRRNMLRPCRASSSPGPDAARESPPVAP